MRKVGPPDVLASVTAQFKFDLESIGLVLVFSGLVVVGVLIVTWYRRSVVRPEPTSTLGVEDYRALMEQGLLEPAEFERIRARLEYRGHPEVPSPPPSSDPRGANPTTTTDLPHPPDKRDGRV